MKFIPIEDFTKPCKPPRSRKEILKDLNEKERTAIEKIADERRPLHPEILANAMTDIVHMDIGNGRPATINKRVRGLTKDIIMIDEAMIDDPIPEPDIEPKKKKTRGPDILSCGHNNWFSDIELKAARDKSLCCPAGSKETGKYRMPYWPAVTTHVPTIPSGQRRKKDNIWHGFCSDDTGKYIGGSSNDCQLLITDKAKRCEGHRVEAKVPTPTKDANKTT